MDPHELLEALKEAKASGTLKDESLLKLVRNVVRRVDALAKGMFEPQKGVSTSDQIKNQIPQMKEYVFLMGPALFGDLKSTPSSEQLGVADLDNAVKNARLWQRRIEAREKGWLIEAIALTAYELEEWLRIYIVSQGGGSEFHADDRLELGTVISFAEKHDLDSILLSRLRKFNKLRNRALHRLLRGEIVYKDLEIAYDSDPELPQDTKRWVFGKLPTFQEASPEWNAIENWRIWQANGIDFSDSNDELLTRISTNPQDDEGKLSPYSV